MINHQLKGYEKKTFGLGRTQIIELVKASLNQFVIDCLTAPYDVIVPIQEEGLAIFLPRLKDGREGFPEIIPSQSLEHVDKEKLFEKKVLLVEAAVRTGGELHTVAKYIRKEFDCQIVSTAAFLVLDGFPNIDELVIPGFHILSPNQYIWAKEVIVEYLLNSVFVRFADPPLWEYKIDQKSRYRFIQELLKWTNAYVLPELAESHDWIRISITNIHLQDRGWLHESIAEVQAPQLIRILVHKSDNIVRILPLFFPKVPDQIRLKVTEVIETASPFFPEEFEEVISLSREVAPSPYNTFRWVSVIGSLLLLRDFFAILLQKDIYLSGLKLSAPIPNLYQYSCSESILGAFETLADAITSSNGIYNQHKIPKLCFDFTEAEKWQPSPWKLKSPYENNSPEEGLMFALSSWINETETLYNDDAQEIIDRGLPIDQLYELCYFMTDVAFNRALDRLIDEGMIKARLGRDSLNRIVRTYAPGSETIRMHLRSLGRAIEINNART